MKPTLLALLLASSLAFAQKFQDVSQKGSPVSLSIGFYPDDPSPYVFARNNSTKGVLAIMAAARFKNKTGQTSPGSMGQDYAFKSGPLRPNDQRGLAPVFIPPTFKTIATGPNSFRTELKDTHDPVKLKEAVGEGAVLFVQFEDGSTWGDSGAARDLLESRPQRLAYLKRLVETYYENGEDAFNALLNEPKPVTPEWMVAGCLQSDATYEKTTPIELAKKRFAAAQGWHASGIF